MKIPKQFQLESKTPLATTLNNKNHIFIKMKDYWTNCTEQWAFNITLYSIFRNVFRVVCSNSSFFDICIHRNPFHHFEIRDSLTKKKSIILCSNRKYVIEKFFIRWSRTTKQRFEMNKIKTQMKWAKAKK